MVLFSDSVWVSFILAALFLILGIIYITKAEIGYREKLFIRLGIAAFAMAWICVIHAIIVLFMRTFN